MSKQKFQDAMQPGVYNVKVYKQAEWEDGKKIEGSHKSGQGKFGNWYLYDVKYDGEYYSLFGNDTNKDLLDSGEVALNVWFAKGKKGVEVLPSGDIQAQPQNIPTAPAPSNPNYQTEEKPDWDSIALGKCRTLFAVEAFKLGKKLDEQTAKDCNDWAKFCIDGKLASDTPKEQPKAIQPNEPPLPEYPGEEIDVTNLPF